MTEITVEFGTMGDGTIQATLSDGREATFPAGTPKEAIQKGLSTMIRGKPEPAGEITAGGVKGATRDLGHYTAKEGPQVLGGVAGGLAQSMKDPRAIPMAGAVAFGAGAGEAYRQIGQHMSGSPDAPKTFTEAALRIGKAGGIEAGFELIGGMIMRSTGKILAPFKSKLKPGVMEAADMFDGQIQPMVLTPAEAGDSRILNILQNVAESSMISEIPGAPNWAGGLSIESFKRQRQQFFDSFADSLIDQFGSRTSPDQIGELFVTSLQAKQKVHKEAADILYNNVADLIPEDKVVTKQVTRQVPSDIVDEAGNPIMKQVTEDVEEIIPGFRIPTANLKKWASTLKMVSDEVNSIEGKNAGDDLVSAVLDLPDEISYEAAKELRSRMISRANEFSVMNKKAPAIGKSKRFTNMIDQEMSGALKALGGGDGSAYEVWRTANRFYKDGQEKFNNTFLRRMIKMADESGTGAENIAPAVFKPGQVSKVRMVKRALDPTSWRKMQGFFVQHLLQKSTDTNGNIVGKKLLNNMVGKPSSFGDGLLNETFSQPQVDALKKFAVTLKNTQGEGVTGLGKMAIQFTQIGAMASIPVKGMTAPAATVLFGPPVVTALLLNPRSAKMLTRGISLPAHSAEAGGLISRITAAAYRYEKNKEE